MTKTKIDSNFTGIYFPPLVIPDLIGNPDKQLPVSQPTTGYPLHWNL
jgi:hypothetical protein